MKTYTGQRNEFTKFKINFGKKVIRECPNSYASWEYVGDALEAHKYYNSGYLPETYDERTGKHLSILDQSDFYHKATTLVDKVKNKAEANALKESESKVKSKGKK